MRNYSLSDAEAGNARTGWHFFEARKTSKHDAYGKQARRAGQSWADYMDEIEDRQLLERRRSRRFAMRALFVVVCAVLLYAAI